MVEKEWGKEAAPKMTLMGAMVGAGGCEDGDGVV
jgi:hypothetical protein